MAGGELPEPSPQPLAPPTQPAPLPQEAPRAAWPTVLGIIAIIWACFGVFGSICGRSVGTFTPSLPSTGAVPGSTLTEVPLGVGSLVVVGVSTILAVILFIMGIGLLRRRRWSARIAPVWSVIDLASTIGGACWTAATTSTQALAAASQPGGAGPPAGFMESMMMMSIGCGAVLGCWLPILLLVWFSRRTIKAQVAEWE